MYKNFSMRRIRSAEVIFLCLLIMTPLTAQELQWMQTTGPLGGGAAYVVHAENGLYAGSAQRFFRFEAEGAFWEDKSDRLPNFFGAPLTINRAASLGTSVFLSGGGGIYRTTDRGESWVNVGAELSDDINFSSSALTANGERLYAGTTEGLFFTTDNGDAWVGPNTTLPIVGNVAHIAADGATLLVSNGSVAAVSQDHGASWTLAGEIAPNAPSARVMSLAIFGDELFASMGFTFQLTDKVFRSIDNGESWEPFTAGGLGFAFIFNFETSADELYGCSLDGIWSYRAGAEGWTHNPGLVGHRVNDLHAAQDRFLAATGAVGVFQSFDQGVSWDALMRDYIHTNIGAIIYSGDALYAAAGNTGVFRSTDGGMSWTAMANGIGGENIVALAAVGDAIFAGTLQALFRSVDQGAAWTRLVSPFAGATIDAMVGRESDVKMYVSANEALYVSDDAGESWTLISNGLPELRYRYLAVGENALLLGAHSGAVYLSNDDGASWNDISQAFPDQPLHTLSINGSDFYAGFQQGRAYRSLDNGAQWQRIFSRSTGEIPNVASFAFYDDAIVLGTSAGVFRSSNNGGTFFEESAGLTDRNIASLVFTEGALFAGTSGSGVFRSSISASTDVSEHFGVAAARISIAPNPTADRTTITYSVDMTGMISLVVTDLLGRTVATPINGQWRRPGVYSVTFNAAHLPGGVLTCRLLSGLEQKAQAILVIN